MKIVSATRTQHFVLRLHEGDTLPETLVAELRARQVTAGTLTLTGIVAGLELAAYSAEIEGLGGTKQIAGPLQAVVIEGSVGVAGGDVALDLRAVLARETDRGLETIAGHLVRAKVVGLEGSLTVFEDLVFPRALDKAAGVRLLHDESIAAALPAASSPAVAERPRAEPPARPAPAAPPPTTAAPVPPPARSSVPAPAPSAPPAASSWSDAVAASAAQASAPRTSGAPGTFTKPPRRVVESEDGPYPVAGDTVEHFAFGSCEVLKSDGDRLHVRMKDGRIREIAVEMLKVTLLGLEGAAGEKQRYRLDRKL